MFYQLLKSIEGIWHSYKMRNLLCGILVFVSLSGEAQVLLPNDLVKLVADDIPGFRLRSDNTKSTHLKLGDITYSMCQKEYTAGSKRIKILLFDFNEAQIMYVQATRGWLLFEALDSEVYNQRQITEKEYFGWETYHIPTNTARVYLGINSRFMMTVETTNVDLESLGEIIHLLMVADFAN